MSSPGFPPEPRDFLPRPLTNGRFCDTLSKTVMTEHEYPAHRRTEKRAIGWKRAAARSGGRTAPPAGPETGAVPFPQQKD